MSSAKTETALRDIKGFDELKYRIDAVTGLIFVNTYEENKLITDIRRAFPDQNQISVWSLTQGLHTFPASMKADDIRVPRLRPEECKKVTINGMPQPTFGNPLAPLVLIENECHDKIKAKTHNTYKCIYVLRDMDKSFNNLQVVRKLRDIIYLVSMTGNSIIIVGPSCDIPVELEKDSALVKLLLPDYNTIKTKLIDGIIGNMVSKTNERVKDGILPESMRIDDTYSNDLVVKACQGLNEEEILNACAYSIAVRRTLCPELILNEKKQIINKSDILTYVDCTDDKNSIGGFDIFKEHAAVQQKIMDHPEEAEEFGAEYPKGALILGVQGSGKSAIAKATAQQAGKGLIMFDVGRVFAGLVGESEKRMRQALAQCEAAGGVIMIDEIDKSLAGASGSDKSDGGTTKRVIGTLLTWMQEKHPGVYLIATANDITALINAHPELLRKGRFDEIFFSDVPTVSEADDIIKIHLNKRKRDASKFDTRSIAEIKFTDGMKTYGYTGAEYEHAIKEAIKINFSNRFNGKTIKVGTKDDIKTQDIIEQLLLIKPITKIAEKPISEMRKWARENARNVSSTPIHNGDETVAAPTAADLEGFDNLSVNLR